MLFEIKHEKSVTHLAEDCHSPNFLCILRYEITANHFMRTTIYLKSHFLPNCSTFDFDTLWSYRYHWLSFFTSGFNGNNQQLELYIIIIIMFFN